MRATGLLFLFCIAPAFAQVTAPDTPEPQGSRSRTSRRRPPRRSSCRRGCPIFPLRPRYLRRARSSSASPARRASSSTPRPRTVTRARSRMRPRASNCSRSAAPKRAATSCCSRSPTRRASSARHLKRDTAALADPRTTDQAAAEQIVEGARPIYYFNAALHSDETGSTESMLELAYRLAVSDQPMIQHIRENLVVLINPVSNPDGRDKVVDWFYRFLKGKTDAAPAAPVAALLVAVTRSSTSTATRTSSRTRPPAPSADVLRLAPAGRPRPARGHPADGCPWNGTGPLQPEHRSDHPLTEFLS